MRKRFGTVAMLALTCALLMAGGQPAAAQEFYQGKTVTVIVGSSPGGSLDTYSRLIARRMGGFLPGNPTVIVQNMPGAGSLIAANRIYNVTQPDGLTIGAFAVAVVLQQVMGEQAAKFDGRKFGWLGAPSTYHNICVVSKESHIKSIDDWLAVKQPPGLGGMGVGAGPSDVPRILTAAIGLPLKLVEGYSGGAAVRLALERGEVDGYCGSWQGIKSVSLDAIKSGKYVVALQASPQAHPDLPNVPLAINYAKSDEAKQLLEVNETTHGIEFVYATSPGLPKERLQIMRTAFMQTLASPDMLADTIKAGLELDAVDGLTIDKKVEALYALPTSTVSKLKEIFAAKEK